VSGRGRSGVGAEAGTAVTCGLEDRQHAGLVEDGRQAGEGHDESVRPDRQV